MTIDINDDIREDYPLIISFIKFGLSFFIENLFILEILLMRFNEVERNIFAYKRSIAISLLEIVILQISIF
jgi:hypothetical protein